jgi:hypothetical protein
MTHTTWEDRLFAKALHQARERIGSLALQPFTWHKDRFDCFVCSYQGARVAWIKARQSYCDRGHWEMHCELPGLDAADGFPRYCMTLANAIDETERFLRWRMFKIRSATSE